MEERVTGFLMERVTRKSDLILWRKGDRKKVTPRDLLRGLKMHQIKRCTCLQRFTSELKCPNQRQGAFLKQSKCTNHPEPKAQCCRSQKVGFSNGCLSFDSMHF